MSVVCSYLSDLAYDFVLLLGRGEGPTPVPASAPAPAAVLAPIPGTGAAARRRALLMLLDPVHMLPLNPVLLLHSVRWGLTHLPGLGHHFYLLPWEGASALPLSLKDFPFA